MPSFSSLVAYVPVALVMAFTPGPATFFVLSRASSHGKRAGLVSAAGLLSGTLVLVALAAVGLTGLLDASPVAFEVVKAAGAVYLVYLGIRVLTARGGLVAANGVRAGVHSGWLLYRDGIVTELLNPKAALFYASVLPQFVDAKRPDIPLQIFALGVVFVIFGSLALTLIALVAATAKDRLLGSLVWQTATRWVSGLVLVALGLRLAVSKAR